jgi:hypothetical protein
MMVEEKNPLDEPLKDTTTTTVVPVTTTPINTGTLLFFPYDQFSARYGEQFFTAQVTSYKVIEGDKLNLLHLLFCLPPKQFTVYTLTIKVGWQVNSIDRRYSEFEKVLGSAVGFPSKTVPRFDDVFLSARREQLNACLSQYLESSCRGGSGILGNDAALALLDLSTPGSTRAVESTPVLSASESPVAPRSEVSHTNTTVIDTLRAEYTKLLEEKSALILRKEELLHAVKQESDSHALTARHAEDIQGRLDEELASYAHAKIMIEDLQNRLDEEMNGNEKSSETIEDLRLRIEEELTNQSGADERDGYSNEDMRLRSEELQILIDAQLVSYGHSKVFIEDLQVRLDEEIQDTENVKRQENDLKSRLDEEIQTGVVLRHTLEELESKGQSEVKNDPVLPKQRDGKKQQKKPSAQ